jgi:hypothetical protein
MRVSPDCWSKDLCEPGPDIHGANPQKQTPMSSPRGSERRGSAQRVNPTSGLHKSHAHNHYTSLFIFQNPNESWPYRDTPFLRSCRVGCHFHQTAASSLPSRHGNRTHPQLKGRQPGRQCRNSAVPWRLLGTFTIQQSTGHLQCRRSWHIRPSFRCQSIPTSASRTHTTVACQI